MNNNSFCCCLASFLFFIRDTEVKLTHAVYYETQRGRLFSCFSKTRRRSHAELDVDWWKPPDAPQRKALIGLYRHLSIMWAELQRAQRGSARSVNGVVDIHLVDKLPQC